MQHVYAAVDIVRTTSTTRASLFSFGSFVKTFLSLHLFRIFEAIFFVAWAVIMMMHLKENLRRVEKKGEKLQVELLCCDKIEPFY